MFEEAFWMDERGQLKRTLVMKIGANEKDINLDQELYIKRFSEIFKKLNCKFSRNQS